jgi:hypothetical protein
VITQTRFHREGQAGRAVAGAEVARCEPPTRARTSRRAQTAYMVMYMAVYMAMYMGVRAVVRARRLEHENDRKLRACSDLTTLGGVCVPEDRNLVLSPRNIAFSARNIAIEIVTSLSDSMPVRTYGNQARLGGYVSPLYTHAGACAHTRRNKKRRT